ncbi:MAG: ABC transporter permease [Planctomycetota bacterium]
MDVETSATGGQPSPAPPSGGVAGAADGGWVTARPPQMLEVLQRIVCFPALCVEHRDLIRTSVRRELQARFTGTALGWFWPLLQPLLLFAVYYFIFTKLLGFKFGDALPEEQKSAFGIFMFVGVVMWASVAESLQRGCNVIVENGNLIKKLAFPSEVLPLNVVLVSLVTMLFAIGMFIVGTFTPVWITPGPMLLWLPLLVLIQGVFTLGLTLFLSALQVFLRDTLQVVTVVVTVWMFVTPLFWAPEVVGDPIEPYMGLVRANPMYHLVYAYRAVLMSSEPAFIFNESFGASVAIFSVWALVAFALGYGFFILCQRRFADEV